MRTLLIISGTIAVVVAIVAVIATFAIRGLRKYVRSLWPHS